MDNVIVWRDRVLSNRTGQIPVPATTFEMTCSIIRENAKKRQFIAYSELMDELKLRKQRKIQRGIIGFILDEVNQQVSANTNPSIYPTSIVVHKGTKNPGVGFWRVDERPNCLLSQSLSMDGKMR